MSQHVTLQASELQVQSTFVRRLLEHEQLGFDVFWVQINGKSHGTAGKFQVFLLFKTMWKFHWNCQQNRELHGTSTWSRYV